MGNLATGRAPAGGADAGIGRMPAGDNFFVPNGYDNVREELELGA